MVISPPFLPVPKPGESEADWMARAMQQQVALAKNVDAQEGSFPISGRFMWHTGVHLSAPYIDSHYLPVRSIADGTVIHVRQPTAHSDDPEHPLNYSPTPGPKWTDDGCVIIRHSTEIGAIGDVATSFTYYTLTMHLCKVDPAVTPGKRIYRKAVIGQPGKVYAAPADIHFEVCCNEAQLTRLIGRKPAWRAPHDVSAPNTPTANGRTDAVFGDLFIYLPAGTAADSATPKSHLRSGSVPAQTLGAAQWVNIRYEKGQAYITSLDLLGKPVGATKKADNFEYELYDHACERHKQVASQVVAGLSSPSGWYELLRFGRNLGPDPLPADAAHWREIPTSAGTVWADLNSPGTFKFSDADFPYIAEWNFFSDDRNHDDQRCQSPVMERWIGDPLLKREERFLPEELARRLGTTDVKNRLRRAVCFFPTEWERATIETRHSWLRDPKNLEKPASEEKWEKLKRHAMAITAPDLPEEYKDAKWRFHPTEFVAMMKKVGWLSAEEAARCFGGTGISSQIMTDRLEKPAIFNARTGSRPANLHSAMQRMLRKYLIVASPIRMAYFFGQISEETGNLASVIEKGHDQYFDSYEPSKAQGVILGNTTKGDGLKFKGRGLIQLTGRFNYSQYSDYRQQPDLTDRNSERLASVADFACDAAGFFWASKQRYIDIKKAGKTQRQKNGERGINFWCDHGATKSDAQQVTKCINGAMVHFEEVRWPAFLHCYGILNTKPDRP